MIFIIPFEPPPSSFVTTLKGFLFVDEDDAQSEIAVSQIVTSTMFSDDGSSALPNTICRFIARNRNNIDDTIISIDDALRFIRSSIRVKRLNLLKKADINTGLGKPTPVWNIYFYPPTTDQTAMRDWRDIIRRTRFVTDVNRAGYTCKPFNCTVCHSEDHPAGMCPYPSQQGWTVPTPPLPTQLLHPPPPPPKHLTPPEPQCTRAEAVKPTPAAETSPPGKVDPTREPNPTLLDPYLRLNSYVELINRLQTIYIFVPHHTNK